MADIRKWLTVVVLITLAVLTGLSGCARKTTVVEKPGEDALGDATITEESLGAEGGERKGRARRGVSARAQAFGPEGIAFESEDVHFEYDSSSLTGESRELLQKKAAFLKKHPEVQITIEGHCDQRGSSDYNLGLGQRRADAVKSYLMDLGVADARMATVSYGKEQPLDPGQDEAAFARNRRGHLVIGGLTD